MTRPDPVGLMLILLLQGAVWFGIGLAVGLVW